MKLQVGTTYEHGASNQLKVVYVCVAECEATTVRFKRKVPGYQVVVLAVDFPSWWCSPSPYALGSTLVLPRDSHMTVGVRRLS